MNDDTWIKQETDKERFARLFPKPQPSPFHVFRDSKGRYGVGSFMANVDRPFDLKNWRVETIQ